MRTHVRSRGHALASLLILLFAAPALMVGCDAGAPESGPAGGNDLGDIDPNCPSTCKP